LGLQSATLTLTRLGLLTVRVRTLHLSNAIR